MARRDHRVLHLDAVVPFGLVSACNRSRSWKLNRSTAISSTKHASTKHFHEVLRLVDGQTEHDRADIGAGSPAQDAGPAGDRDGRLGGQHVVGQSNEACTDTSRSTDKLGKRLLSLERSRTARAIDRRGRATSRAAATDNAIAGHYTVAPAPSPRQAHRRPGRVQRVRQHPGAGVHPEGLQRDEHCAVRGKPAKRKRLATTTVQQGEAVSNAPYVRAGGRVVHHHRDAPGCRHGTEQG